MSADDGDVASAAISAVLPTGWVVFPSVYDAEANLWRAYARNLCGAPR